MPTTRGNQSHEVLVDASLLNYSLSTMGRHPKILTDSSLNLDVRAYGYYSTPGFVADFIATAMLALKPDGEHVLDPAVGREELLPEFLSAHKTVDAFDVYRYKDSYSSNFLLKNFLDHYMEWREERPEGDPQFAPYDYYIMNPPYNCHEVDYIRANKVRLKEHFCDVGVLNMYSMFLSATIDMAKDGALIGAIISDSFLNNSMHRGLRKKIFETCSLHYLLLCPTELFQVQKADVRTAIVILQKGVQYQKKTCTLQRPVGVTEFRAMLQLGVFAELDKDELLLTGTDDHFAFVVDIAPSVREIFQNVAGLGKTYPCLTGISTGNDRKYLSQTQTQHFSVPFYKNPGKRKFFAAADGFLPENFLSIAEWHKTFIVRNKFYLCKESISCSSMGVDFSAAYRPSGTTFGVNANIFADGTDLWWLMAYLNSTLVLYMVRAVIIRSNMITSGYVARIPLIHFEQQTKNTLEELARAAHAAARAGSDVGCFIAEIDSLVFSECNLPEADEVKIRAFSQNLLKKV